MGMTALFQEVLDDGICRCLLCPHRCRIKPGQRGICRVRHNESGTIELANYGQVSSLALDPIEKKPLYHFFPGKYILSAGSWGCNFCCPFCQNHSIAHGSPATAFISPEEMLELCEKEKAAGSVGLAFTYNEPLIWYEYIMDTARLLHQSNLQAVLVTNGYINPEPLQALLPLIDAANIDLKSFNDRFYRRLCKAEMETVKDNIRTMAASMHIEVTTLVIPGENDNEDEINSLAAWLAEIDRHIPLHLSAYHPAYKMNAPPTPVSTMYSMRDIARQHLEFVYAGNLPGEHNNTCCISCGQPLIKRRGYLTSLVGIDGKRCRNCQAVLDFIIGLEE